MVAAFNYIDTLRTNCIPAETPFCDKCACWPNCLVGTELQLTVSNITADKTLTYAAIDCDCFGGTNGTKCKSAEYMHSNANSVYVLTYTGSGYELVLSSCATATDLRAHGILISRISTMYCNASSPCVNGATKTVEEHYIASVTASLSCDSATGQMTFLSDFTYCGAAMSFGCDGSASAWSLTTPSGLGGFVPIYTCTGGSPAITTREHCERSMAMTRTMVEVGDYTKDCSSCGNASCAAPHTTDTSAIILP